ncbi:hypothetical protein [Allokutzneria oryzae]|uniref:Lipoprotein n=1 Tax=Allokutzneria oryzae TaxID=1378989 RepID=A0ABV5ZS05_9PSEU
MALKRLLLAVAVLTACSAPPPPAPRLAPTTPTLDMITWVGKVCQGDSAMQELREYHDKVPPHDELAEHVRVVTAQTQALREAFAGIGRSPVAGGDEVVGAYLSSVDKALRGMRETERSAGSGSDLLNRAQTVQFSMVLQLMLPIGTDLQNLIDRDPVLAQAFQVAEPCRRPIPLLRARSIPTPTR